MRRLLAVALLALGAQSAAAKPWAPTPPCAAPLGVDEPAVPESMCSRPVAQAGSVVVREIGLPVNATLAIARVDGPVFYQVLAVGIQTLLGYFKASGILGARTTPITARNVGDFN